MTAPEPLPRTGRPAAGKPVASSAPRRMLLVVNPHASSMSERLRRRIVDALSARYRLEAVATHHQGHAIELARDAAREGCDIVVALGGDGTINEVANGLVGTATALGCLPAGATNVYCRMLGIPRDVDAATGLLLHAADSWRPRGTDVGCLNDRWFTFSAGIGLDASVVEQVDRHPQLKANWGPWFFAGVGLAVFMRRYVRNPPRLTVDTGDGRTITGVSALVQNGNPYTYFRDRPIVLDEDGGLHSGALGGVVLTRASAIDLPPVLWRALSGRRPVSGHRRVERLSGLRTITVRSADGRPLPLQVDGDHVGDALQARLSVVPGGLRVVC